MNLQKKILNIILTIILLISPPLIYSQNVKPLPIDSAFQFFTSTHDSQTILTTWKIAPGYYLYRDHFTFQILKPNATQLGQPLFPISQTKKVDKLGEFQIYQGTIQIPIPVLSSTEKQFTLLVTYQGCSQQGYCYPPITKAATINLAIENSPLIPGQYMELPNKQLTISNQQKNIFALLTSKNYLMMMLSFFAFGLIISLTPCVLPMIPILSAIIIGKNQQSKYRPLKLSLIYVLGMAITYAGAGLLFGWLGGNLQTLLQQPWIIILFSLVFVLLAFSLFGFFQLQLPEKIRDHLTRLNNKQKNGTYLGCFIMGCLSVLIVSPCVTPPLVAVLSFIGQNGDPVLGGIALFIMGIGMGAPLIIIGTLGEKILPKSGPWLEIIKLLLGFAMLATAIWMLSRIVPGIIAMILWGCLFIGIAFSMRIFKINFTDFSFFKKLCSLASLSYGLILLIGAIQGNTNPLQPLHFHKQHLQDQFITIKNINELNHHLALAKGKPVLLDFYADWCIACKQMEKFTFPDSGVKKCIDQYVLLRADVTNNNAESKKLLQHLQVIAPPSILFFNSQKQEIQSARIVGEVSANTLIKYLQKLDQHHCENKR